MEGFKGTRGKWSYSEALGEVKSDAGGLVADMIANGGNEDRNGRLIAAAPDLLAALIEARVWVQGWNAAKESEESYKALKMCNKAISKALGQ